MIYICHERNKLFHCHGDSISFGSVKHFFLAIATPNTEALPGRWNIGVFGGTGDTESRINSKVLGCSESTSGNVSICFWCSDISDNIDF